MVAQSMKMPAVYKLGRRLYDMPSLTNELIQAFRGRFSLDYL
jgi:hypothetical protein